MFDQQVCIVAFFDDLHGESAGESIVEQQLKLPLQCLHRFRIIRKTEMCMDYTSLDVTIGCVSILPAFQAVGQVPVHTQGRRIPGQKHHLTGIFTIAVDVCLQCQYGTGLPGLFSSTRLVFSLDPVASRDVGPDHRAGDLQRSGYNGHPDRRPGQYSGTLSPAAGHGLHREI